ncbi:MAG: 23S rRNA (pseudouridine(1915)-N(3))-methyltransferase RlmH [Gemmatimonadota bacterium]
MELAVVVVGSPRTPGMARAIEEYETRARRYFRLEVAEMSAAAADDPGRARAREGRALMGRVPDGLRLFALTRRGKALTSDGLARHLRRTATYGRPGAAFVVGGAHGLAPEVIERADHRLSLSPMTLPHQMARLVLMEQIYRAGTILRGEPYHKGG